MTTLTVTPIAGALGAEVAGVNLAEPLGDNILAQIHGALLAHSVIFFHDQKIAPEQQIAFARRFGDIHLHPFIKGLDEHPEIIEIIKQESDTRNFGGTWHTDQMFNRKPAMGTLLYAHETPDAGGDTMFAGGYAAYEALSDGMKEMLGKLHTFNTGDRFKHSGGLTREETMRKGTSMQPKKPDAGQDTEAEHPLIRTHPETGRKSLYVGSHTQRFAGMTDAESEPLLNYLQAYAVRPEFTCRFRWKPGSIAFWDNRCTQHFAVDDYPGKRRRMHRITIAGDEPF